MVFLFVHYLDLETYYWIIYVPLDAVLLYFLVIAAWACSRYWRYLVRSQSGEQKEDATEKKSDKTSKDLEREAPGARKPQQERNKKGQQRLLPNLKKPPRLPDLKEKPQQLPNPEKAAINPATDR